MAKNPPGYLNIDTGRYTCCDGHWKCYCKDEPEDLSLLDKEINFAQQLKYTDKNTIDYLIEEIIQGHDIDVQKTLEDAVQVWHSLEDNKQLVSDFLGLSPEEYNLWIINPNSIWFTIEKRIAHLYPNLIGSPAWGNKIHKLFYNSKVVDKNFPIIKVTESNGSVPNVTEEEVTRKTRFDFVWDELYQELMDKEFKK